MPAPFELWLAQVKLRRSEDIRPVVIVSAAPDQLQVMVVSSQMDLFHGGIDFKIDAQGASFKATGLRRTSYVIAGIKPEIRRDCLTRRIGVLEDSLRAEFERWANG